MVEHRLSKGNCCIETFLSTYDRLVLARIYPSKNILYLFFLSVHFLVSPLLVRILGSSSLDKGCPSNRSSIIAIFGGHQVLGHQWHNGNRMVILSLEF